MPNPILPLWEYIPDGEPRVFGDRVYLYGSHDRVGGDLFCDFKLKVWSASIHDLNNWVCHGDSFRTRPESDAPWTDHELFAPDVIKKDDKYYLYAYIVGSKGAVGVSDKPEGPFKLISTYQNPNNETIGDDGIFNDAGVLVDDDGKVYVYYGFTESHMNELNPDNMCEVLPGSYMHPVINDSEEIAEEQRFFEASSPRKIGDTYYLIYSPRKGSRLAYATSKSPKGPFTYRGYIIDNGVEYPAGNNHGSIVKIGDQWYVFYHRMTNNTIMSRRACVEKISIAEDGTIPTVEMTSLGFEESLNPYKIIPGEIACVLVGECFISELDLFTRVVTNIKTGNIIGYKYFDFGEDNHENGLSIAMKVRGQGVNSEVHVYIDDYPGRSEKFTGTEIGVIKIGMHDGVYTAKLSNVTGRHSVFFVTDHTITSWVKPSFDQKNLFELIEFTFLK